MVQVKSTLLEAIAIQYWFNPEWGSKNFNFSTKNTHSPILLAYPNSKIIQISEQWVEEIKYKETNNYQLYKTFLDNPDYMLKKLGISKIQS